ncbi:hypothetical protein DGG96_14465 [Legionella qingyii]|uniref:Uncharacterized protein n=1 Tax=Legionella qingyii TaxID=2184757 RepID=A0A317U344_9GAMM|nr:hypothetical protein DGG96_14465 [Legionella qingyii]
MMSFRANCDLKKAYFLQEIIERKRVGNRLLKVHDYLGVIETSILEPAFLPGVIFVDVQGIERLGSREEDNEISSSVIEVLRDGCRHVS